MFYSVHCLHSTRSLIRETTFFLLILTLNQTMDTFSKEQVKCKVELSLKMRTLVLYVVRSSPIHSPLSSAPHMFIINV